MIKYVNVKDRTEKKYLEQHRKIFHNFAATAAKSLQSCLTLCDPIDASPPGSSVHGIFQARVLEWGAFITFSSVQSSRSVVSDSVTP